MKETIEQAAREYADGLRSVDKKNAYDNIEVDSSRMVAFKRGAEWQAKQSPWKITANEPPPEYTDVLLSAGSRPDIFVGYFNGEDFRIRSTEETIEYFRVLHWMPIPE